MKKTILTTIIIILFSLPMKSQRQLFSSRFEKVYTLYLLERKQWEDERRNSFKNQTIKDSLSLKKTTHLLNTMLICANEASTLLDCISLCAMDEYLNGELTEIELGLEVVSLLRIEFNQKISTKENFTNALAFLNNEWITKVSHMDAENFTFQLQMKRKPSFYPTEILALILFTTQNNDQKPFSKEELKQIFFLFQKSNNSFLSSYFIENGLLD